MSSIKISYDQLHNFILKLLCLSGVEEQEALVITKIFIWFDLIGRENQGVGRLDSYLKRVNHGLIKSPCDPEFIQKADTIFIVNGNDGFGHYLGHIAMLKAIETANKYGIGMVGVNHSNHFGAGAYYVQMAAEDCKIGLAFSNAAPKVAPLGGISAVLGTNPFAFGAPVKNKKSILVDLSTSASSGSMIRAAIDEGKDIPEGILVDKNGNAITDPNCADQGVILPFGGAKGFCLGLMVEILSAVITNSGISHEVASMYKNFERSNNVGHLFLVIDILKIMSSDYYFERMGSLIGFIKDAKKAQGIEEILLPGETRWRHYENQLNEGLTLSSKTIQSLNTLANKLKVVPPW